MYRYHSDYMYYIQLFIWHYFFYSSQRNRFCIPHFVRRCRWCSAICISSAPESCVDMSSALTGCSLCIMWNGCCAVVVSVWEDGVWPLSEVNFLFLVMLMWFFFLQVWYICKSVECRLLVVVRIYQQRWYHNSFACNVPAKRCDIGNQFWFHCGDIFLISAYAARMRNSYPFFIYRR